MSLDLVLEKGSFVGTERRLNTIFHLLRQMTLGPEADPEARLAELTRRREIGQDQLRLHLPGQSAARRR